MRTDELLKILRSRGAEGVSTNELANLFGFKLPGSASKLIKQLRAKGYVIERNPETRFYVLIKDLDKPTASPSEDSESPEGVTNEKLIPDNDAKFFKISGKKEKILEILVRAGSTGASTEDISKYSGVSEKNIAGHIHSLRHADGKKIILEGGVYILKGGKKHPLYEKGIEALPVSDNPVELEALLGDKRLLRGISRIPRGTQLATYLDLIQKIIYYTKCALAMHETVDALEALSNGEKL